MRSNSVFHKSIKKYFSILFFIVISAFAYTFMIALLFAQDTGSINYFIDSGVFASIIGCVTMFIVYKLDSFIQKHIKGSSKSIFLINFFISFFITALLLFSISWVFNIIIRGQFSLSFSFVKEQIIIINYVVLLILSYHTIAFYTRSITNKNKALRADNIKMSKALSKYLKRIPTSLNKETKLIAVDDVLYFQIDEGVVFAFVSDDKKFPLTISTLNTLESKLNPTAFFRINRSEIVNVDKIESFEPYFKDRLAIKLSKSKTILYTSNKKSAAFRKWLTEPVN